MVNKGNIKTQRQYDNEVELRELYKEAYLRGEMKQKETFCSLVKMLGFGKTMAESLINKWGQESGKYEAGNETVAAKKRRNKRQVSLEKQCVTRRYRKKSKRSEKETEKPKSKEALQECSNCKYINTCPV